MSKLEVVEAASTAETGAVLDLPERIQVSLGEITRDARDGVLALSVRVGLAVLGEMMEWEVWITGFKFTPKLVSVTSATGPF